MKNRILPLLFSLCCILCGSVCAQELLPDQTAATPLPTADRNSHWLTWANNTAIYHMLGFNSTTQFYAVQRFATSDLTAYNGMQLTKVRFLPSNVASDPTSASYSIVVYTGGDYYGDYYYNYPGSLVASQVVNNVVYSEWNTVTLNTPITINASQELWIGVYVTAYSGYAMSHDDATPVNGKGNLMGYNGYWGFPSDFFSGADVNNWNIAGLVSDGTDESLIDLSIKFINNGISQTEISNLNVNAGAPFRPCIVVRNENTIQADMDYTDTTYIQGYMDGIPFSTNTLSRDTLLSGHGVWLNVVEMAAADVLENGYCGSTHTFCYKVHAAPGWADADTTNNEACITVTFADYDTYYEITVLNTDGTISPDGIVRVPAGQSKRFTITAPDGMRIAQALADGLDVTDDIHTMISIGKTYTFNDVQADHTFEVLYELANSLADEPDDNLSVYPNPATDQLTIKTTERIREVRIFDLTGRQVWMGDDTAINIQHLTNGTYILQITTDAGVQHGKFVKQ